MYNNRACAIVVLAAAFFATSAAAAPGPTFVDPAGDAAGAPDITSVAVSSDSAGLSFAIHTSSAAAWTGAAAILEIDADADPATGDAGGDRGAELSYVLHSEHTELTLDGSGERRLSTAATWHLDGATLTISVPAAELGPTSRISFWISTPAPSGEDKTAHWSFAPGSPVTRISAAFTPAVHGHRFALTRVTTHFADGTTGTAPGTCVVMLAGRRLAGGCAVRLPATSRGGQLAVTVTAAGVRVVNRFRVR